MDRVQLHRHTGGDSPKIRAQDITGASIITADLLVSAQKINPSIVQRGTYTLVAGVKFVSFPQTYIDLTNLQVFLTSDTANQQFLQGVAVSGFTVSGSSTNTGRWLSIGYK